ncbi:hypothetical protein ACH437_29445 [Streptomyces xinghaiensis]|uniref:hypothetical protein n=1 Tax=Streptomyces xinghaiensis TaxID=1038928 RepID=UPI0037ACD803
MKIEAPRDHGETEPSPGERLLAALQARIPEEEIRPEGDRERSFKTKHFETLNGTQIMVRAPRGQLPSYFPDYQIGVTSPAFSVSTDGEVLAPYTKWFNVRGVDAEISGGQWNEEPGRTPMPDHEIEDLTNMMWDSVEFATTEPKPQAKPPRLIIDEIGTSLDEYKQRYYSQHPQ